jgi:hypothetical protein
MPYRRRNINIHIAYTGSIDSAHLTIIKQCIKDNKATKHKGKGQKKDDLDQLFFALYSLSSTYTYSFSNFFVTICPLYTIFIR